MTAPLRVSADAQPECIRPLRNVVASLASDSGLTNSQVKAVKLCVHEAIANVVKHAYPRSDPGPVEVSVQEVGDDVAVVVADHGRGRRRRPSDEEGSGFGLAFIARFTDGCTFTATSDGATVEMLFPLPRGKGVGPSRRLRTRAEAGGNRLTTSRSFRYSSLASRRAA
jgi:anti-sigma regulatory factor (Ser/Thr protein kinase)